MKFSAEQLNTASQNFFRCDFKELDKSNQRWIIEGLERIAKMEEKKMPKKEKRSYIVSVQNTCNVRVEASSEEEAEELVNKEIEDYYDYPWDNCEDYDGWEIKEVREA